MKGNLLKLKRKELEDQLKPDYIKMKEELAKKDVEFLSENEFYEYMMFRTIITPIHVYFICKKLLKDDYKNEKHYYDEYESALNEYIINTYPRNNIEHNIKFVIKKIIGYLENATNGDKANISKALAVFHANKELPYINLEEKLNKKHFDKFEIIIEGFRFDIECTEKAIVAGIKFMKNESNQNLN
jgi:hypothetical protein